MFKSSKCFLLNVNNLGDRISVRLTLYFATIMCKSSIEVMLNIPCHICWLNYTWIKLQLITSWGWAVPRSGEARLASHSEISCHSNFHLSSNYKRNWDFFLLPTNWGHLPFTNKFDVVLNLQNNWGRLPFTKKIEVVFQLQKNWGRLPC